MEVEEKEKVATREALAKRWKILGIVWTAEATTSFIGQALPAIIPLIQREWALTRAQVGILTSVRRPSQAACLLFVGWLSDRVGVKRIMPLGQIIVALSFLALALVGSFEQALIVFVLVGPGIAVVDPSATAAVTRWFPSRSRGTAMGLLTTSSPVVGILSASTLPALALAIGWRQTSLILAIVAALLTAICLWFYQEPPSRSSIAAKPMHIGRVREVILNRNLWISGIYAALINTAHLSLLTYFMLYMEQDLMVPLIVAGMYLAVMQVGSLVGRVMWGMASDVVFGGRRKIVLIIMGGLMIVSILGLAALPTNPMPWLVVLVVLSLGLSADSWTGVFHTLVPELTEPQLVATALGFSKTVQQVGSLIGVPILGYIADIVGSYRLSWVVISGLMLTATLFLFAALEEKRNHSH